MSTVGTPAQPYYPQIDKSLDPKVSRHLQEIYPALNDHNSAIVALNSKVADIVSGKTVIEKTSTTTSGGTTIAGVSSFNGATGGIYFFPNLGQVNPQLGVTIYSVETTDNGALVILSDGSAIAVGLNSAVTTPYLVFITNLGAGTATLTPSPTGTVNGGASFALLQNYTAMVFFDGTNWWATALPIVPVNTNAIAHQFFTAYNATTGAFTQAQPAFTDISGIVAPSQLPTPTAATLGGVKAAGPTAHEWVYEIDLTGTPLLSQPAYSDISGTPNFADGETPSGLINGINTTFTLANAPSPALSLILSLNGMVQQQGAGDDYTLAGNTITFLVAPVTGPLIAWYRY